MKYLLALVAALGFIAVGTASSFATTGSDPIYMQYGTTTELQGDVLAKGHENWIAVDSLQFDITKPVSITTGLQTGAPVFSEITITKLMDKSSVGLMTQSLQGTPQTVTIDFVRTSATGQVTYAEYILNNAIVSEYSVSSGGDLPTETVKIAFTKITFKFTPQNPDGTLGTTTQVAWDLSTARLS